MQVSLLGVVAEDVVVHLAVQLGPDLVDLEVNHRTDREDQAGPEPGPESPHYDSTPVFFSTKARNPSPRTVTKIRPHTSKILVPLPIGIPAIGW